MILNALQSGLTLDSSRKWDWHNEDITLSLIRWSFELILSALQSGLTLDGGSERDWHNEDITLSLIRWSLS
jgi:hypothetical protein